VLAHHEDLGLDAGQPVQTALQHLPELAIGAQLLGRAQGAGAGVLFPVAISPEQQGFQIVALRILVLHVADLA